MLSVGDLMRFSARRVGMSIAVTKSETALENQSRLSWSFSMVRNSSNLPRSSGSEYHGRTRDLKLSQ